MTMSSHECFPGSTVIELPRCAQALLVPEAEIMDSRDTAGTTCAGRDIKIGMFWSAQALLAPEAELPDSKVRVKPTWIGRDIKSKMLWSAQAMLAVEAELLNL